MTPAPTAGETKRCSACGVPFTCGARADSCWCQALPPLPPQAIAAAVDCLCEACLRARVHATTRPDTPV